MTFSADGTTLAAGGLDGSVRTWSVGNPNAVEPLGPAPGGVGGVTGVVFSPVGAILASANEDDTVRLTDLSAPGDPAPLTDLHGHRRR